MKLLPVCPQCRKSFPDEDFCPDHGEKLAAASAQGAGDAAKPEVEDAPPEPVAVSVQAASHPHPQPVGTSRESALERALRKFGARHATGVVDAQAAAGAAARAPEVESSPIPPEVLEKGWRITGSGKTRAGVDRWPVERRAPDGAIAFGRFCRFRTGCLTDASVYGRVENRAVPGLVRVWQHGTVNVDGARADYELGTLPKTGRSLTRFLNDGTPSEERALRLLPPLAALLRQLEAAGVRPLGFEPRWLQLTHDGELWLAMAGALVSADGAGGFRPEVDHSPLLPRHWTAPELTEACTMSASAPVFSAGQVLAQAVWGEPCSLEQLRTGTAPFHAIRDEGLARVLMGCLWPRPSERWNLDQLSEAASASSAATMPPAPPWASLAPGAATTAFAFAGAHFWRLEDMVAAAVKPGNWDEAIGRLDAILEWAGGTAWSGQAQLMREARASGRSPDWVLVALAHAVLPAHPPTWRAVDFSDRAAQDSLAALAQRVLEGSEADAKTMRELFAADLRGAFAQRAAPQG